MKTVIGVDLGGTNIVSAVVDDRGKILGKDKRPTESRLGPTGVLKRIVGSIRAAHALSGKKWESLLAVGIGSPGPLDSKRGVVVYAPNLNWRNVRIVEFLRKKTGKTVFLENDANLAALGESWIGSAKGEKVVLCVTLGTGVGGGIILNGKIYEGASGVSSHIGHVVVDPNGPPTPYGNRGVLEQYVSATGIVRLAREAGLRTPGRAAMDAFTIRKMASAGNRKAVRVYRIAGRMLGIGLTSAIHLINPGMVVFCGGVSAAGNWLFRPMHEEIRIRCFKSHLKGLRFRLGGLGGDMGVIGAARFAFQALENQKYKR